VMKKMLLAAGIAASILFAGCASTGSQSPAQVAAAIQVQVTKACAVIQPTMLSLEAMQAQLPADAQADLAKAQPIIAAVCTVPAVQITSVRDFVNVAFPSAIKIVAASPLNEQDKTTAEIALTAASVAVSAALAQYAPDATVAPDPASGTVAS
uniref:hypothetical protein n=2 Tax=Burkholderia multivorans TaxID=87883 RepID=UPI0006655E74